MHNKITLLYLVMSAFLALPTPKGIAKEKKPTSSNTRPPQIKTISHHPQLFLDDYLVAGTSNLKREIRKPKKYPGNPILSCDYPWEASRIYYPVVLYEPKINKFRMWYTAFADKPGDNAGVICYAESDDGFKWKKPMLRVRSHKGQFPTNIVLDAGPVEAIFMSVIKTPHDPQRLYKGLYWHRKYPEAPQVYGNLVVHSKDGIHWSKPEQVIHGKSDTTPSLAWHPSANKYLAFLRAHDLHHSELPGARLTGIAESRDFDNWTPKKVVNLATKQEGYPYTQFYGMSVCNYGDLLIGQPSVIHLEKKKNNFLGKMNIQLTCSRDGYNWHRVADRSTFLDVSPDSWDSHLVHAGSLVVKDNTAYIYYYGTSKKHGTGRDLKKKGIKIDPGPCALIAVATMPADRFVACRPDKTGQPAILETPLVTFKGNQLLVNAEINTKDLQIEILNQQGRVIEGFERQRTQLLVHDRIRYQVFWSSDNGPQTLKDAAAKNQPVALRFILHKGNLYAFQITQ